MRRFSAVAALFAFAASAQAGELTAYAGESIELGSIRGVAYYYTQASGCTVVTTLADGEAGLPLRFETILADKQRLTISVPGKLGEPSQALEISRAGDRVILSRPPALETKAEVVTSVPHSP